MKLLRLLKKIPLYFYILFFVSYIILIPANNNLGIYGHDFAFHILNIISMDSNSSFFNLPTRIRPIIANNFGYASGIFYPQLFHVVVLYLFKFIKLFDIPYFSVIKTINVYLFLFIFLVGIVMRKLLFKYTSNSKVSTLGSIFYITYPYFITDIYTRSAYGELTAFLALPIIFLGLYSLFNEKKLIKFYLYFIFGFYLLFSSHLISSLFVTVFTGIFILCHYKVLFKNHNFVHLASALFITLCMSLNSIIPIIEHKLLGNYLVFLPNYMSSRYEVWMSILDIKELFIFGEWLNAYIPIFLLLLIVLLIIKIKKVKRIIDSKIIIGFFLIFIISILLVLISIIWDVLPSIFIMIQFAWRNCAFIGFSACVLATFGYLMLPKKYFSIVSISILIIIFSSFFFINNNSLFVSKINTMDSISDGMGVMYEYLPVNTHNNIDYFNNRGNDVKIIKGDALINVLENNTPYLSFSVDSHDSITVEVPRLYYLWYEIELISDHNVSKLDYYENGNGFIEFDISNSGIINVKYKKSFISNIAFIISLVTFIMFFSFLIYYYLRVKKS